VFVEWLLTIKYILWELAVQLSPHYFCIGIEVIPIVCNISSSDHG
jgi:hypothetical protein